MKFSSWGPAQKLSPLRNHFFYYGKTWNGKTYPFANVNFFWHLIWTIVTIWTTAGNIYLLDFVNLRNLQCRRVFKWKHKHILSVKKFEFLQMYMKVFCHFKFCHYRRKDFSSHPWECANKLLSTCFKIVQFFGVMVSGVWRNFNQMILVNQRVALSRLDKSKGHA